METDSWTHTETLQGDQLVLSSLCVCVCVVLHFCHANTEIAFIECWGIGDVWGTIFFI